MKFIAYETSEFRAYLETAGIYFVMSHDGSNTRAETKHEGVTEEVKVDEYEARKHFRKMIFWFTLRGFNIALINEIEWRDSKVC